MKRKKVFCEWCGIEIIDKFFIKEPYCKSCQEKIRKEYLRQYNKTRYACMKIMAIIVLKLYEEFLKKRRNKNANRSNRKL